MATDLSFDWQEFLAGWSDDVLAMLRRCDPDDLDGLETEALGRGSLAYPGATAQEIEDLTHRLGVTLPPSYVEFLKVSNGWIQVGMDAETGKLWSTTEVKWLREQDPDLIRAWTTNGLGQTTEVEISDED
jgi:cell wall assembly regulator SMI1